MSIQTGGCENLDHAKANSLDNELLTAIARSAEDLTTGRGWPDGVNALLEDLGKITKVNRVWIFQTLELHDHYVLQDYVFEWASAPQYVQIGLPIFNRFKSKLDEPEYQSLIQSRKKAEYQLVKTGDLVRSWLKNYLENQNILSMLTIPIFVENEWWGTLGFDDCERSLDWSTSEIALLRTASFLISSAVLRDSLSAKKRQLEILKRLTAFSAWELDTRRWHLWCTSELLSNNPKKTNNLQFSFRQWLRLIHPSDRGVFFNAVRQFLNSNAETFTCDLKVVIEKDRYRWVEVSTKVDQKKKNRGDVIAGVLVDITKRKHAEERLRHEASTDPLTGVLNRRKIESLITTYISQSNKTKQPFSLLLLDLDFFKGINDKYGHLIGDRVLCHFTLMCKNVLRHLDYLARIGGEEFAVLLPNTTESEAHTIANRICQNVRNTAYDSEEEKISYTVSIGCYTSEDNTLLLHEIFERADHALYLAKRSGRDQVKVS